MESLDYWTSLLPEINFSSICDIVIVALMIYSFLIALKRTRRSGLILTGIVILTGVYLAARKLNLFLTVSLLHGFYTVILVALVVIFQEDLRYIFERVGLWWLERRLPPYKRRTTRLPPQEAEVLGRTLADLARAKIGALVVIRGRDTIARYLNGGEEVQGLLSEPLLKSIFDPHSIGHDGAVIIDGRLIDKLGCYLPLSKNLDKLPHRGTRHAAALGLSELCDALCVVVSEEQGTISIVRYGDIWPVSTSAELADALRAFYDEIAPQPEMRSWTRFLRRNYREKAGSLGLAVALWILLGFSAEVVQRTIEVPVKYTSLPDTLIVETITPAKVQVTLSGQRKAFAFLRPGDIKLALQLRDARKGKHPFSITRRDISYPSGLELEEIQPTRVLITIEKKPPVAEKGH
jgi:diadenylate cyclase